ncbi:MAG: MFS transporter [Candidatus Marinimicrobia bacterium]|nr:MFS transporter [Candidatus Neomarinimicrobiota bacterium]
MYNRKIVFLSAIFGIIIFGISLSFLGSVLPLFARQFSLSGQESGQLILYINLGIFIGSLLFGPIIDRFGYKHIIISSSSAIFIGLLIISIFYNLYTIKFMLFVIGLGAGAINGISNALASEVGHKNRTYYLSILGTFFCVGAFGFPLIFGTLLNISSPRFLIFLISCYILLSTIIFSLIKYPSSEHDESRITIHDLSLLKSRTIILFSALAFFESGIEMSAGNWTTSFFSDAYDMEVSIASFSLSTYWLGMMAGRFYLSRLSLKYSPTTLFFYFMPISTIASVILIFTKTPIASFFLIFLTGYGFSCTYPIIIAIIGDIYKKIAGTALSLVFSIAILGGILLPYTIGIIYDLKGMKLAFSIIPIGTIVVIVIFYIIKNNLKKISYI